MMQQPNPGEAPRKIRSFAWRAGAGTVLLGLIGIGACSEFDRGSGVLGPVLTAPSFTIVGTGYTYTTDEDFAHGTLVNVNFNAPNSNQLQLNEGSGTFPFIWISLSQRCTIAKVNTATGQILGEYRTVSDGRSCNQSSRTTVATDGSVWVGHRGTGGVAHIGIAEFNQCVDRNNNGVIETSTGYGDVLAWPGSTSDLAQAQDECIIHHINTDALGFGDTRHLSIDADNTLWIGSFGPKRFVSVNGATGAVGAVKTGFSCGGYGGLIDGNGVIWSTNGGSQGLLRWDPKAPDMPGINPRCIPVTNYGLAIDPMGWLWANEFGTQVRKISPDGMTILGPFNNGSPSGHSQGLAIDANGDVWVSSGLFCYGTNCGIGHLKNDGTLVGTVPNPTGPGSTGISIDAAGYVWSVNLNANNATRINPNLGALGADNLTRVGEVDLTVTFPATPGRPLPYPYNYSDMTGAQLLGGTTRQGSWTVVQDAESPAHEWGPISWNSEPQGSIPPGASIVVEARAANAPAGLGSELYGVVENGVDHGLVGRYIQVRVTLRAAPEGASPVLSDLSIGSGFAGGGEGCSVVFWQNHLDRWTGVTPTDFFDPVFGITLFSPLVPLGWVIRSQGQDEQAFGREATAALLNAWARERGSGGQYVNFRYDVEQVLGIVQGMTRPTMRSVTELLSDANEQRCPLSEGTPRR
jgi:streptogramin lyase